MKLTCCVKRSHVSLQTGTHVSEESAASIVRERRDASYSNKYWAAQCAKYQVVQLDLRLTADCIECAMESVYQTARSKTSRGHNMNKIATSVTIYIRMIYISHCTSYSGVSAHKSTYVEFNLWKKFQEFWKLCSLSHPLPQKWLLLFPITTFYTAQSSLQPSF
jgi:hypothetical protein